MIFIDLVAREGIDGLWNGRPHCNAWRTFLGRLLSSNPFADGVEGTEPSKRSAPSLRIEGAEDHHAVAISGLCA